VRSATGQAFAIAKLAVEPLPPAAAGAAPCGAAELVAVSLELRPAALQ